MPGVTIALNSRVGVYKVVNYQQAYIK